MPTKCGRASLKYPDIRGLARLSARFRPHVPGNDSFPSLGRKIALLASLMFECSSARSLEISNIGASSLVAAAEAIIHAVEWLVIVKRPVLFYRRTGLKSRQNSPPSARSSRSGCNPVVLPRPWTVVSHAYNSNERRFGNEVARH